MAGRIWSQGKMMDSVKILSPELTSAISIIESKLIFEGDDVATRRLVARFEKSEDAKMASITPELIEETIRLILMVRTSLSSFDFQSQVLDSTNKLEKILERA